MKHLDINLPLAAAGRYALEMEAMLMRLRARLAEGYTLNQEDVAPWARRVEATLARYGLRVKLEVRTGPLDTLGKYEYAIPGYQCLRLGIKEYHG